MGSYLFKTVRRDITKHAEIQHFLKNVILLNTHIDLSTDLLEPRTLSQGKAFQHLLYTLYHSTSELTSLL